MNTAAVHFDKRISRHVRTESQSTSPSLGRRQPLLQRSLSTPSPEVTCNGSTAAECCGGTTAECAAVCCCCPCGLVNLLVLAMYKVPAGLCRRAIRHRRRKRLVKRGLLPPAAKGNDPNRTQCQYKCRDSKFTIRPLGSGDSSQNRDDFVELKIIGKRENKEEEEAVAALEKEMWNRFYGAGFWRSPSQSETASSPATA